MLFIFLTCPSWCLSVWSFWLLIFWTVISRLLICLYRALKYSWTFNFHYPWICLKFLTCLTCWIYMLCFELSQLRNCFFPDALIYHHDFLMPCELYSLHYVVLSVIMLTVSLFEIVFQAAIILPLVSLYVYARCFCYRSTYALLILVAVVFIASAQFWWLKHNNLTHNFIFSFNARSRIEF